MLIVRSCVDKALKLYHVHEFGVVAAHWVVTITLKAQLNAILSNFNPEAVLVRAPLRRMKLELDVRGERQHLKLAVLCVEEEQELCNRPIMLAVR